MQQSYITPREQALIISLQKRIEVLEEKIKQIENDTINNVHQLNPEIRKTG